MVRWKDGWKSGRFLTVVKNVQKNYSFFDFLVDIFVKLNKTAPRSPAITPHESSKNRFIVPSCGQFVPRSAPPSGRATVAFSPPLRRRLVSAPLIFSQVHPTH
jgi:hypothetical protein